MDFSLPQSGSPLGADRVAFLDVFMMSCRRTILEMLRTSQSGHPGGSLSMLDFLAVLYAFRLSETNERLIVSNGHVSPGVYSVLAEMGVVDRQEVVDTFRQLGSVFEGHVTRHIPGIFYGTGPLGIGVSVAAGMAWSDKYRMTNYELRIKSEIQNPKFETKTRMTWATLGDGEAQEGQVHEMALFAAKYKLDNLAVFVDYNRVQLTDSLEEIMPIDVAAIFRAHGWHILEIDGHDAEAIWQSLHAAENADMPTLIVGTTIMGNGIPGMEEEGQNLKATWHGKAPQPEQIEDMLRQLSITNDELRMLDEFRQDRNYTPPQPEFIDDLTPDPDVDAGSPQVYEPGTKTDCRSAYGNALLDLAKRNNHIVAGTADLGGSVKTAAVGKELPAQHIEYGICEQHMVSSSGALSLSGLVPFCSTFGAFMTSRAKDQARVNDINHTNVKMVATHCGLSVGEDGPTHQAIDDMGSMVGLLHTHVIEPADANHCDRIIRYVASHHGNFYVRMGRHKFAVLLKEDGSLFFDADYVYTYGKCDVLRPGSAVTIVASGACATEALKAREESGVNAEIVIASSIKKFDQTLADSLRKTGKVITVEDHNPYSGLGAAVAQFAAREGIALSAYHPLGVTEYQLSGKAHELYHAAGIDSAAIVKALEKL